MPRWFRRSYRRWANYQLSKRGYLDFLPSRPPHAYLPDFSDLWFLYKTVRDRKPRCILEFGSGCSTVIMAQALWDSQRESSGKDHGYLYSVDADAYWTNVTTKSVPDHLRAICEVWYSPLLEVEYLGIPAFRHARVPDVVPDFVYLDGPDLTPGRQVVVDVLDIEHRLSPGFSMVVDGRKKNTDFLLKHLRRQYTYKHRRQFHNSVFVLVSWCSSTFLILTPVQKTFG